DVPVGEVTGGCFCCRFEDLHGTMTRLLDEMKPDLLFAEAVGSCTDVKATVVRPLQEKYPDLVELAPLTVFVDPARFHELSGDRAGRDGDPERNLLAYLFHKQLEEAQVIALNKVDLLGEEAAEELAFSLSVRHPKAQVRAVSALTGSGLDDLLEVLFRAEQTAPVGEATLLVNARVELQVPRLEEIVSTALRATDDAINTRTEIQAWQCFSPPRPRPTYRLTGAAAVASGRTDQAEESS